MNQRLRHLDGLRALSVALVVCFHAEVPGFGGGFIGVSLFFTLSGYLLTFRLLQVEPSWAAARSYWAARWRRIMPAALTVIVLVLAYETWRGIASGGARRLWLTTAGLSNWMQVADNSSYADLFAAPDMLLHYWSLAVEEQTYLLLPLVLFACLRRSRRAALVTLATVMVLSFIAPLALGLSVTRTYYGTDTRVGEIIAGSVLALLHSSGTRIPGVAARLRANATGTLAIVVLLVLAVAARPGSDFVRYGMLPLTAATSVAILHAARTRPDFALGIFETRPLVTIGRLSYAIYLVHWPVLVVLGGLDISRAATAVLGALLSVAIAWPIDRWVERPLRFGDRRRARLAAGTAALAAIAAFTVVAAPASRSDAFLARLADEDSEFSSGDTSQLAADHGDQDSPVTSSDAGPVSDDAAVTVAPRSASVGVFGDSIARTVANVIRDQVPRDVVPLAAVAAKLGCGLLLSAPPPNCVSVLDKWRTALDASPADVAVVISCQWELIDRDIPGIGVRHVGQPELDDIILADYRRVRDALLDAGVSTVAWTRCPELSPVVGMPDSAELQLSRDPRRVAALNRIIDALVAESSGTVVVFDLATWVDQHRDDATIRPDGSHFEWEQPNPVAAELVRLLTPILAAVDTSGDTTVVERERR